jgi:hypothetical protein
MPQLLHYLGVDAVSSKQRKSRVAKDSNKTVTAKLAQDALRKIEQQQQPNSEVQQVEDKPQVHPEVAGGLDWGVLAVYTCPRNCSADTSASTAIAAAAETTESNSSSSNSSSSGYVREVVWRQGPMDGAYVDSDSDSDCDNDSTTTKHTATTTISSSSSTTATDSTSSVAKSTATASTTAESSPSKSTNEDATISISGVDSSSDTATPTAVDQ